MIKAHNFSIDQINLKDQMILLSDSPLPQDKEFLKILEMNLEQLTHFLENRILDNPFIEMDYSLEQFADTLETSKSLSNTLENLDSQVDSLQETQSLESYLFQQIMLYRHTPIRDVMLQLVHLLDENGFLPYDITNLSQKLNVDEVTVLDAVTLFKQLEPAGIGGKDLREVMMIQADQDDLAPKDAYRILDQCHELLKAQEYETIQAELNLTSEEIEECLQYYQTLAHRPVSLFSQPVKQHIIPDVFVSSSNGDVIIQYNRKSSAKIYFNQEYFNEMKQYESDDISAYLKVQLQDYEVLAQKIRMREELLMVLIQQLVESQKDYFLQKETKIKTLTVKQLAQQMNFPEGYIYRLLSHKKLKFNDQLYSLSDFINMKYSIGREGLSAQKIREKIQSVLAAVDNQVSNQEIVERLKIEGIRISENIVGMYRKTQ